MSGFATQAGAATIADASFESPALPAGGYSYQPTNTGWTFNGYAGIASNGSPFYQGSAPNGVQAAFLQTMATNEGNPFGYSTLYGSLSQTINDLIVGTFYTLTFDLAARCPNGECLANTLTVDVGGRSLGQFSNASTVFGTYTTTFQATNTSELLAFVANTVTTTGEQNSALDNITITAARAAVPEPATMSLLGIGVAGMLMARRRRNAA